MELRVFHNEAAAFSALITPFLLTNEAALSLLLGLSANLATTPAPAAVPYLAAVEEAGQVVAVALRTPPHPLHLSLTDHPAALDLLAADLHQASTPLPGVIGPAAVSRAFAVAWQRRTGPSFACVMSQRIYQLTRVIPVTNVPGELRPATTADLDLLHAWSLAFHSEAEGNVDPRMAEEHIASRFNSPTGGLMLWWDRGQPVSLAGYTGPTPNGIRIGPVYTPPEHRRRGYASAVSAALSQYLLDRGRRYCFLSTDLANPTSNHVYQAIGYEVVCDVDNYTFAPTP